MALQQQQLPEGVSIAGLHFQQQPLQAGDQAISYIGSLGVTGGNAGTGEQLGLRMDAIRTGGNIALMFTTALPGGAAITQPQPPTRPTSPTDPPQVRPDRGHQLTSTARFLRAAPEALPFYGGAFGLSTGLGVARGSSISS